VSRNDGPCATSGGQDFIANAAKNAPSDFRLEPGRKIDSSGECRNNLRETEVHLASGFLFRSFPVGKIDYSIPSFELFDICADGEIL
jgi:hypothetical protein